MKATMYSNSSSEDESSTNVAFTTETDFEDGQWIGGEFYARGLRKRKRPTKDDQIYGIFNEDQSDQAKPLDPAYERPVQFVSASSTSNAPQNDQPMQFVSGGRAANANELSSTSGSSMESGKRGGPAFQPASSESARGGLGFQPASSDSSRGGLGFQASSSDSSRGGLGFQAASSDSSRGGLGFQAASSESARGGLGFQPASSDSSRGGLGFQPASSPEPAPSAPPRVDQDAIRSATFDRLVKGATAPDPNTIERLARSPPNDTAPSPRKRARKGRKDKPSSKPKQPKAASWEKKVMSGIGRKYLEKYGFEGRLGKNKDGISKPIEVQVRPNNLGLGFGGFKEAVHLNKQVHKEQFAKDDDANEDDDMQVDQGGSSSDGDEDEEDDYRALWKKYGGSNDNDTSDGPGTGKPRRASRKKVYKTSRELLKEQHPAGKNNNHVMIIDRRTKTPKLVGNLKHLAKTVGRAYDSDASSSDGSSSGDSSDASSDDSDHNTSAHKVAGEYSAFARRRPKRKLGQELVFNVKSVVEIAEMDLSGANAKRDTNARLRANLEEEEAQVDKSLKQEAVKASRLDQVVQLIANVRVDQNKSITASDPAEIARSVARLFSVLKTKYQGEYATYRLDRLANALVIPAMKTWAETKWDPLERSAHMNAYKVLKEWKSILTVVDHTGDDEVDDRLVKVASNTPLAPFVAGYQLTHHQHKGDQVFSGLLELAILPRVREAVSKNWQVSSPEPALELFLMLQPFLPSERLLEVLRQTVTPKLVRATSTWDPSESPLIHLWLHPWLRLLPEDLAHLYPSVRNTMEQWMTKPEWDVRAEVGRVSRSMLLPWKGHWSVGTMERVVTRCVVPKFVRLFASFEVNPADQQGLDIVDALLHDWVALLPTIHVVWLLCGEFFPKWLNTVSVWLATVEDGTPNVGSRKTVLGDIGKWYVGWKGKFPKHLQQEKRIMRCFTLALEMISGVKKQGTIPAAAKEEVVTMATLGYKALARIGEERRQGSHRNDADHATHVDATTHKDRAMNQFTAELSLKDSIEVFAGKHGVAFMPHPRGRMHDGKKVYKFGSVHLLVDKESAFMEVKSATGDWAWEHVTSFEKLLEAAT